MVVHVRAHQRRGRVLQSRGAPPRRPASLSYSMPRAVASRTGNRSRLPQGAALTAAGTFAFRARLAEAFRERNGQLPRERKSHKPPDRQRVPSTINSAAASCVMTFRRRPAVTAPRYRIQRAADWSESSASSRITPAAPHRAGARASSPTCPPPRRFPPTSRRVRATSR